MGSTGSTVLSNRWALPILRLITHAFHMADTAQRGRWLGARLQRPDWGTVASYARWAAFRGDAALHAFGGVALKEIVQGVITASEMRLGLRSNRPYGLPAPRCPQCKLRTSIEYEARDQGVDLRCVKCKLVASRVKQPGNVLSIKGEGDYFHFPFPYPEGELTVDWKAEGIAGWSGSARWDGQDSEHAAQS